MYRIRLLWFYNKLIVKTCMSCASQPKMMKWIYSAVITPRTIYASLLWWEKIRVKSVESSFKKLSKHSINGDYLHNINSPVNATEHPHRYVKQLPGQQLIHKRECIIKGSWKPIATSVYNTITSQYWDWNQTENEI